MKQEARVSVFKGLDNIQDPHGIGTDTASTLTNLLASSEGVLHTRPGYKELYAGIFTAAHGNLAISGGQLVRVSSVEIEVLGPITGTQLRSTSSQGRTFVSTEDYIGVLDPELRPLRTRSEMRVVIHEGALQKGLYLVATVDEGGYLPSQIIGASLEDIGSILVVPTGGRPAEVYMSVADGTELFFHSTVPASGGVITSTTGLAHPIQRQYLLPMPPGVVLSEVGGSLVTAIGNYVTCSMPLDYEAYDPASGVFLFPNAVTMVEECVPGVTYIGTSKELYLARGKTPEDWAISLITPVGVLANSAVKMRVKLPKSPVEETVVLFTLTDGSVVAGRNNEETVNMTEQVVQELKTTAHGAIVLGGVNYTIY